jgi:hypothetical protein
MSPSYRHLEHQTCWPAGPGRQPPSACVVQILGQGRDLGFVGDLPDDGVPQMNAFK